jgi:biopolymer transport protein TolR
VGALRPGSHRRAFSEINVTPFVDVMLVLLIIFMVAAPMLQQGIEVELPKTTTQPLRMDTEPLVLTVKKDGTYLLARQEIPIADLQGKLEAIFEGLDEKEIHVRADTDAPYGTVVKAMAAARLAGAHSVGIVTDPE